MSPNPLRVARGTTASILSRTLKPGELAQSTDTELVHVGDGAIAGGRTLAYRDEIIDFPLSDYDNVQDAIDAAYAYGNGAVILDRDFNLEDTALLKDYVRIECTSGITVTWTGGDAPMFSSAANNVLLYSGITGDGATLAMGANASKAVEVYGSWGGSFKGFRLTGTREDAVAIDLRGDGAGGINQVGGRHCSYNKLADIIHYGVVGTFLRLYGETDDNGFITLNTFDALGCEDARVYGIDFARWCDHNIFSGMTRLGIKGNNSVGVIYNSASPTQNIGVYSNNFEALAVDSFGTYTNRIGIKINNAKNIMIPYYYQSPVAEGGSLVTTNDTGAYWINHFVEAEGVFRLYQSGVEIPYDAVTPKPKFMASTNAATVFNSASEADMTGWTERFDEAGDFDPTTGVFTAPITGRYQFDLSCTSTTTNLALNDRFTFRIRRSGYGVPAAADSTVNVYSTSFGHSVNVTAVFDLTAGQTVKATVIRLTGSGEYVLNGSHGSNRFSGYLLD